MQTALLAILILAPTVKSVGTIRAEAICAEFAPSGTRFAAGMADNTVRICEAANASAIKTLRQSGLAFPIQSLAWNPKTGGLAGGAENGKIHLWDPATGNSVHLMGHQRAVIHVAFNSAGTKLLSTCDDDSVRVWDVKSRKTVLNIRGSKMNMYSAEFSPDGTKIIVGSLSKGLAIYSAANGTLLKTFGGHNGAGVQYADANSSFSQAASAGRDNKIGVWDLKKGTRISYLSGHADYVSKVEYSANGKWLASTSQDGSLRVWDVATLKQIAKFDGMSRYGSALSWSANSGYLVACTEMNNLRVYSVK
jgi:WD40 repeat protein